MKKHRYCEDKCQILEHKGYHTCAQTGRCEYLDTPAQLPNCPIHGSSWCSCPHIDEPTVDSVKRVASKLSAQPLEHTKDCAVHEPVLRPCSCGLETRLRANAQYLTAQLALQRQAKIDSQTLVEKLEQQLALTIATLVEEKRNHQTTIDDLLEVGVDLAASNKRLAAVERERDALRAYADNEYCIGIQMAARIPECLGWEAKVKAGRFGKAEMDAHEKMNKHLGAHYGIYAALERSKQTPPNTQESGR